MVKTALEKIFDFLMLGIIVLNLAQRKLPHTDKKRRATLIQAAYLLVFYILLVVSDYYHAPSYVEWILLALFVIPPIIWRRVFFPFKARCTSCSKKLKFSEALGCDESLCTSCFNEKYPEEVEEGKKKVEKKELDPAFASAVSEIDWDNWEADEKCVLTYLFDKDKVLLIHKKKGLGKGYINAPGGHIEPEETKFEAAIRETKEETGLIVEGLKEMGILRFQFKDGLKMLGYVFFSYSYSGSMIDECEETKPFWCPTDKLDYSLMWEDDILWLPRALKGDTFDGKFLFDGNQLIDSNVKFESIESEENLRTLELIK